MTFTIIGHFVSPTNLYGTSAGTLWFTVTDRLVPVVNPARSIITGLRGTRTFYQYKMNQNPYTLKNIQCGWWNYKQQYTFTIYNHLVISLFSQSLSYLNKNNTVISGFIFARRKIKIVIAWLLHFNIFILLKLH